MTDPADEWDGQLLANLAPALARRIFFFEECASTNDEARLLVSKGVSHGSLVIAEKQTAGRGRRGQPWTCPAGQGMACSLILRPSAPQSLWSRFSLTAGLGVAEALDSFGLAVEVKWPNDLWVGRKKICGILVESTGDSVIVGIGLNVNLSEFPPDLVYPATSLFLETGERVSREEVLIATIERVLSRADQIESDFEDVIRAWNTRCALRGNTVTLSDASGKKTGIVEGLSPNGELLLRTGHDLERILQADEIRLLR